MNRVHEQCPKIDSGTLLSQTGSKTSRVHQVHSLLAQQHAQAARPCRNPRMRASRAPGLRAVSTPRQLPRAPHTCCRRRPAPAAVQAPAPCARARPAPLLAHPVCIAIQTAFLMPFSLQYTRVYCNTIPISPAPGRNIINCIEIQFLQQPAASIAIHLTHCTPLLLQYNPPLLHIQGHYITIQCLSCNAIGQ